MATCCASLSSHQRKILRASLAQESEIAVQCNRHITQLLKMQNNLQLIHHEDDLEKRETKCDEFIRMHTQLDLMMTCNYEMNPDAIKTALTTNCICIQAACFRMSHKWIPKLDVLRMKLLKIKTMCEKFGKLGSKTCIELCADIEKTVQNVLKLQTTSH